MGGGLSMGSAIMPIKRGVRDRASDFEGSVGVLHLEQALVAACPGMPSKHLVSDFC